MPVGTLRDVNVGVLQHPQINLHGCTATLGGMERYDYLVFLPAGRQLYSTESPKPTQNFLLIVTLFYNRSQAPNNTHH